LRINDQKKQPQKKAMKRQTMLAIALAFGGAAYGQVTAAASATSAAEATAEIQDGKAGVNGVRYHYLLARGGGQTVVLLHGWGSTSYMWRFVTPQLVVRPLGGRGTTSRRHRRSNKIPAACTLNEKRPPKYSNNRPEGPSPCWVCGGGKPWSFCRAHLAYQG